MKALRKSEDRVKARCSSPRENNPQKVNKDAWLNKGSRDPGKKGVRRRKPHAREDSKDSE